MRHAWALGIVLFLSGCGRGGEETPPPAESDSGQSADHAQGAAEGARKPWDPAAGSALVRGVVSFRGTPPRRRPLQLGGDPQCAALHKEPPLEETVIVGEGGGLANVFVWVKRGLQGWKFPPPKEPVRLTQRDCIYIPHVVGAQVGQTLVIRNDDPFLHNVHSLAKLNPAFNISQSDRGVEDTVVLRAPEFMFKIKCDVHGWMVALVCVAPHPFFQVTGEDGAFRIGQLPPGEYVIEAIHEELGRQERQVTLAEGEEREIGFTFSKE